jgi:hypothetical protein
LFDINSTLESLSSKRPVFRSEKDFQEALLHRMQSMNIKCEMNKVLNGVKVDIWLMEGEREIVVQLKHKTKKLSVNVGGSQFELKDHRAHDQGRYDFFKDIKSLELLCKGNSYRTGYAILLTNDYRYWEKPVKLDSVDRDFWIYEGKTVTGLLSWEQGASIGTKSGREEPIELKGAYRMEWENYSGLINQNSEFRYLCVKVQ